MKSTSGIGKLFSFYKDVRGEIDKIAWPSRKEVIITTIVVFVLAVMASLFFGIVDTISYKVVHGIIGR